MFCVPGPLSAVFDRESFDASITVVALPSKVAVTVRPVLSKASPTA